MITVGNRSVIGSHTVLIPLNEMASIQLTADPKDPPLTLNVVFEERSDIEEQSLCSINGNGMIGTMTITNWSSFGSHIFKPIFFATTSDGRHISCVFSAVKLTGGYRLDIQFMVGVEKL